MKIMGEKLDIQIHRISDFFSFKQKVFFVSNNRVGLVALYLILVHVEPVEGEGKKEVVELLDLVVGDVEPPVYQVNQRSAKWRWKWSKMELAIKTVL